MEASADIDVLTPQKPDVVEPAKKFVRERVFSRMIPRWKPVEIPFTNRVIRPGVDLGLALVAATGMGVGTHKAFAEGSHVDHQNLGGQTRVEQKNPMPSQEIKFRDNRVSEVAGVQSQPQVTQDEKSTVQQEQKDPHPNARNEITESDIQNALKVVPEKFKKDAEVTIPALAEALKERGVDSKAVFAYMLATVEHESMFKPMEEIDGREQAIKYNYPGGEDFFGRGLIMNTGKPNYETTGKDIGLDLVSDPDLLLQIKPASKAAVSHFVMHGTVPYAEKLDFVHARKTINGGEFDSNEEPFKSTPYKVAQRGFDYLEVFE